MKDEVMVSVYCRTYNQVSYIRDALEGILMQETDFPYEVVVFDDASTDGTSDIVREYADKYPEKVQAKVMEKNTWHTPERNKISSEFMKKYLKGKYIAYCEGDDFWIDRHKLQIQVEYMESHPKCVMYIHNAILFDCDNYTIRTRNPYVSKGEKNVLPGEVILMSNGHPPTASFLHKRDLLDKPPFFLEAPVGDYSLLLYAILCGDIHYNARIMSVYRWHANGSHSKAMLSDQYLQFYHSFGLVQFCIKYNKYTDYKYYKWLSKMIRGFADPIIQNSKGNEKIDNLIKGCMDQGFGFSEDYFKYVLALEQLQKQTYDNTFVSPDLIRFVKQFKHILIMGAGNYAAKLAEQFSYNHIEYDGFIVSQRKENEGWYLGKPVWNLTGLPYGKESIGVVVGIKPVDWENVINSLDYARISNYYWPFLLDIKTQ